METADERRGGNPRRADGASPAASRQLIPYGILLKAAYCGVAFYHWLAAGIPGMWKPFALIDLVFAALFYWAYSELRDRVS